MFSKDHAFGVVSVNSFDDLRANLTEEEANAMAAEQAGRTKSTVYIVKVVGTVKPKFEVEKETW